MVLSVSSFAMPAYPFPIKVKQPDGSELTIRIYGDEWFHYTTTENVLIPVFTSLAVPPILPFRFLPFLRTEHEAAFSS